MDGTAESRLTDMQYLGRFGKALGMGHIVKCFEIIPVQKMGIMGGRREHEEQKNPLIFVREFFLLLFSPCLGESDHPSSFLCSL